MLEKLVSRLEETPLTLPGFLAGFAGIVFVRFLLETLSSPNALGYLPIDLVTLVHYFLFYLAVYFALALVLGSFTGDYKKASTLLLFGFVILWLPPILDLLATGGAGRTMAYVIAAPGRMLSDFFTFFGSLEPFGITLGIRVEIAIALLAITGYVYRARRNLALALAAMLAAYGTLFLIVALPSVLYLVALLFGASDAGIISFLYAATHDSGIVQNALPGNLIPATPVSGFETGFGVLMSLILVPLLALLAVLFLRRLDPSHVRAHLSNIRPARLVHYLLLVTAGAFFGARAGLAWPDVLGLLTLLLAFSAAWMFAVSSNDLADEGIDAISNADRPLVTGALSRSALHDAGLAFFLFSLLAGFAAGYYALFFLLAFTACYYVYSIPPLRLKRIPGLSSLLIGLASLSAVLAGFFFASPEKLLSAFPKSILFGTVLCYTFWAHVRDLKDIDGDSAEGIWTVPVLVAARFGRANAHKVVGILVALGALLSPLFFPIEGLWYLAIPFAVLGYLACVRLPYREHSVFVLYFLYLAGALTLFLYQM